MITDTQKTEIRRILGFPMIGAPLNFSNVMGSATLGSYYRIWEHYEWMETRMNALLQDEEVQIFGAEHSQFGTYLIPATLTATIVGGSPVVGAEVQFQVNGSLETYIVQSGDTAAKIAAALAAAIALDATVNSLLVANPEGASIVLTARTPGSAGNGIAIQAFSSDASVKIQLGSGTAQQVVYGATAGGADPPGPRFTPQGQTTIVYGYIPIIRILEADLTSGRRSLTTSKVDVLEFRPTELLEREKLMDWWKREMATGLNLPLYADFAGNRKRRRRRAI